MQAKLKTNKLYQKHMKLTVIFGYSIFAVLIIGLFNTTIIPFATSPYVDSTEIILRRISIIAALVLSAIVPPLVAYIAGDISHRKASRLQRHYDGVMFAALGTWLAFGISLAAYQFIPAPDLNIFVTIWVQFWPSLLATPLVITILAYFYHKKKASPFGPLAFAPFQFLIVTSMLAFIVLQILGSFSISLNRSWTSWEISAFVTTILLFVMIFLSYQTARLLHKDSVGHVSLTAGIVTLGSIATTAVLTLGYFDSLAWMLSVTLIGFSAWALYLFLHRSS